METREIDQRTAALLSDPEIRRLLASREVRKVIEHRAHASTLQPDGDVHRYYQFRPEPSLPYQAALFGSEARTLALIGANQIGKTLCGKRWVVPYLIGFDPLFPERRFRKNVLVWACTEGGLSEGLFDEILEMIPPSEIKGVRRTRGSYRAICTNGKLEMKTFDQKREAMQQAKCDIVWWDEEGPKAHWLELQMRLVSKGGKMLLTMTPIFGTTWLHEKLHNLDPKYQNAQSGPFAWFTASILDNPHVDQVKLQEILEECRGDPDMYAIRVLGQYRTLHGSSVFMSEALRYQQETYKRTPVRTVLYDAHGNPYPAEDRLATNIYEEPLDGHGYAIGVDVATGEDPENLDESSIQVVKSSNNQLVANWYGAIDPDALGYMAYYIGLFYNNALICVEINRNGGTVVSTLRSVGYPSIYQRASHPTRIHTGSRAFGWETNQITKPQLIMALKRVVNLNKISIPCAYTLEQLAVYQRLRKDSNRQFGFGPSKGRDDCVMALALAIQATSQATAFTKTPRHEIPATDPQQAFHAALRRQVSGRKNRRAVTWW